MQVQPKDIVDQGLFKEYRPTKKNAPAAYKGLLGRVSFAKDTSGKDFYTSVYGFKDGKYLPATNRTLVYVEEDSGRVVQVVHDDDAAAFPPNRTMLGHPVRDGVSLRLLSFAVDKAVVPGMVWDRAETFTKD